jgi:phage-related tail fiber protein
MTGKGHFEKGIWVEEKEAPAPKAAEPGMDARLSEATDAVGQSISNALKVAHDLVATEEGKQYIEKSFRDMQTQVQKSFDDVLRQAKSELEKAGKQKK